MQSLTSCYHSPNSLDAPMLIYVYVSLPNHVRVVRAQRKTLGHFAYLRSPNMFFKPCTRHCYIETLVGHSLQHFSPFQHSLAGLVNNVKQIFMNHRRWTQRTQLTRSIMVQVTLKRQLKKKAILTTFSNIHNYLYNPKSIGDSLFVCYWVEFPEKTPPSRYLKYLIKTTSVLEVKTCSGCRRSVSLMRNQAF